jgi:uncharacterized protein (TIGR03067 family)
MNRRSIHTALLSGAALLAVWTASCADRSAKSRAAAADELSGDYVALRGAWTVTHNEMLKLTLHEMHGRQFIFQGDRFHLDGDTGTEQFVLDESSSPKRIDFISGASVIQGIYKLEGDVLTFCTAPPGVARPTRFESALDSRIILTIVKRRT